MLRAIVVANGSVGVESEGVVGDDLRAIFVEDGDDIGGGPPTNPTGSPCNPIETYNGGQKFSILIGYNRVKGE